MKWIPIDERTPVNGQRCLTKMKHGLISGIWDAESETFGGYYWSDMEWYATHWMPIEEAQQEAK